MATNYETFVQVCKDIANNLHTMIEVKEYKEYGWASIAFMTDKFGGVYVHLHYDLKTNKVVNWYGQKNEQEVNDISFLSYFVKSERDKLLQKRDLNEIYEQVNSEY